MESFEEEDGQQLIPTSEMYRYAQKARKAAGLTQEEAAERLSVTQPNISRAESDRTGRYVKLQARMIRELAEWPCKGPLWQIELPEKDE